MTNSLMRWHLARDNQTKLERFCGKNRISQETRTNTYNDGEHDYFEITYKFDNGSYITAELLHGTLTKSYSISDHFQVVDYALAI